MLADATEAGFGAYPAGSHPFSLGAPAFVVRRVCFTSTLVLGGSPRFHLPAGIGANGCYRPPLRFTSDHLCRHMEVMSLTRALMVKWRLLPAACCRNQLSPAVGPGRDRPQFSLWSRAMQQRLTSCSCRSGLERFTIWVVKQG